jgi:hypothetical protein
MAADPAACRKRRRLKERSRGPEPDCFGIIYFNITPFHEFE